MAKEILKYSLGLINFSLATIWAVMLLSGFLTEGLGLFALPHFWILLFNIILANLVFFVLDKRIYR
jgi:hypothetical protein